MSRNYIAIPVLLCAVFSIFCVDQRKFAAVFLTADNMKAGLRLLILGDSNDRYITEEWCQQRERIHNNFNEFPEAMGCYDQNTSLLMIGFTAFKLLKFSVDTPNNSESTDAALNAYFASIARASTKLLGGLPSAVLMQSLFHDLEYTFWVSPRMIHGMAVSEEIMLEWLSQWSAVSDASVNAANLNFLRPHWIGWRNSNLVLQGDHDGWLLLAPWIPSFNAEAARMAKKREIELVDFERFSRLDDLIDYVHPKRNIHQKFIFELMKNLTSMK